MCGIFCLLCEEENISLQQQFLSFESNIYRRGPDFQNTKCFKCCNYNIIFASSVLWLQGKNLTKQPLESEKSIFLYNGDIFGAKNENLLKIVKESGDTELIAKEFDNSKSILNTLSNFEGPYSFIYLNKSNNKIYFARDVFGRRSLLIGKSDYQLILSSVAKKNTSYNFIELPPIGIFCYDLKSKKIEILAWNNRNNNFQVKLDELELFLDKNILVRPINYENRENNYVINFIAPNSSNLKLLNEINLSPQNAFNILLNDKNYLNTVTLLQKLLESAIEKRISTQPQFCKNCIKNKLNKICNHALTGILFSGGIDCSILAVLSDKFINEKQPIDLINVAFENNKSKNFETPDRLSGIQTLNELKKICPGRKWNFLEINVSQKELDINRTKYISDLIYPLDTILDESLGCALWFASRAQTSNYTSPCRVLLVGMGADELFGGYTKHRFALKKNSWEGLNKILNEDFENLPYRNLGRDDRVVSDHARQLRTPYLDENVVHFVRNLNCWEKSWPLDDLPQGLGDKILLRSLGYFLGLHETAILKKRALQFGSRIANSKENANEKSWRL